MEVAFTLDKDVAAMVDRHMVATGAPLEIAMNRLLRAALDSPYLGREACTINELLSSYPIE